MRSLVTLTRVHYHLPLGAFSLARTGMLSPLNICPSFPYAPSSHLLFARLEMEECRIWPYRTGLFHLADFISFEMGSSVAQAGLEFAL